MTKAEHIEQHKKLHNSFDELLADYLLHTDGSIYDTLLNLIEWSHKQTLDTDHSNE